MQIKKTLLAAAVTALVAATAQAQTAPSGGSGVTMSNDTASVTVYGLIDATFSQTNAQNAANQSVTGMQKGWFSGNRWGLQGKLGSASDVKAIFKLESEFVYTTGEQDTSGVLFNRDAWLGLESADLGKLTFGRQNNIARDPAGSGTYGDPYGSAKATTEEGGYTNNNNFKQLIFYAAGPASGDGASMNAGKVDTRYNRGVVWKKEFGPLLAGFGWQTPVTSVTNGFNTNTSKTGTLAYNGPGYTVAGFYTLANVNGLAASTASVGGNYQVSPLVRVNAGLFSYGAKQNAAIGVDRKDTAYTVSAKFTPAGQFEYAVGYQVMKANNAAKSSATGTVANAYADASGNSNPAFLGTGARTTFYGSALYRVNKYADLYAVFDRVSLDAGYGTINGLASQNEVGVGMKLKF
jgi:predicted porin